MPASIEHPRWNDMQGLVASGYPTMDRAQYLLFTIQDASAARDWLAWLLPDVTNAFKRQEPDGSLHRDWPAVNVNVALTAPGLAKLCGLSGDEPPDDLARHLCGFSYPFLEGVHGREHRTRILGNAGGSAPQRWRWGGTARGVTPVHLLLMVYAVDATVLANVLKEIVPGDDVMKQVCDLPRALSIAQANQREHFGFADGISQPILAGSPDAARYPESVHVTALGEFVFGYNNQFGQMLPLPALGPRRTFGANGSYLVLLQFSQDVERFWAYLDEVTENPHAAEQLASKIVGRLPDGTPLVPYANLGDNEFDYSEDPYGYGCPIGAHIRRSNPRDVPDATKRNHHRILRRGRSYGPRARHPRERVDDERGLFFMCLNTDLERQFEFIMQNWTNNPSFGGLGHERDPLIGAQSGCPMGTFTVQGLPAPARVSAMPRFVTVRGAQYFFLPGIRALDALAKGECHANG